jgi:GNAT superfamily N-acetyltransferase
MVAAAGPSAGAAAISPIWRTLMATSFSVHVRRATLADVAAVARLSVPADDEARRDMPALADPEPLSAPELALRLLDDLEDGHTLYVAERERRWLGFAHAGELMVGDGGHQVELQRLYVEPEHRRRGIGRQLLALVRRDLAQRAVPAALRAWAAGGSAGSAFLAATGLQPLRQRWRVGRGGIAVQGLVYADRAAAAGPRTRATQASPLRVARDG